jgi:hypothetical protein
MTLFFFGKIQSLSIGRLILQLHHSRLFVLLIHTVSLVPPSRLSVVLLSLLLLLYRLLRLLRLLSHPIPSSFLYPRVMPHLRVVSQSLHIIIRSGRITLTRVSTVSFAVALYSGRTRPTCASAPPITKAFDACRYR